MEKFDIIDKEGNKTGEYIPRERVHREGLWHKSVHVWIINDKDELLIQKRAPEKDSHPNEWDISTAGHISSGETPISTAISEAKEELGIDITENELKKLFTHKNQSIQHGGKFINNEFTDVYLVRKNVDVQKLKLQPEEVSEVKLVHYKDLQKIISDKTPGYVLHDDEYRRLFEILDKRASS
ncbi:NUDIX domain-containing protein [Patescibacteria group bacterium]